MYIVSTNATPVPPSAAAAPANFGAPATGEELAMQMLSDLGYLALLINNPNAPGAQAQIAQMVATIQANMPAVQAADPAAYAILQEANVGQIEMNGQYSPVFASEFLLNYANVEPGNPTPLATQILNWMSGADNNGQEPFSMQNATDPNTTFAYLMFMSSLYAFPTTQWAAQQDGEQFFGFGGNGPYSTGTLSEAFLAAYLNGNPGLIATVAYVLPYPNIPNAPNYDAFVEAAFGNPGPYNVNTWQPPAGLTDAECVAAMQQLLDGYMPN